MRDVGKLLAAWTARDIVAILGLSGIWALAPVFGSPSSIWVMPIVALAATAATATPTRAVILSLVSLVLLVVPWSLAAVFVGSIPWIEQATTATVIVAINAPVVAGLTFAASSIRRRFTGRATPG